MLGLFHPYFSGIEKKIVLMPLSSQTLHFIVSGLLRLFPSKSIQNLGVCLNTLYLCQCQLTQVYIWPLLVSL